MEMFFDIGMTPKDTKNLSILEQAFLVDSVLYLEVTKMSVLFPKLNMFSTGSLQYNEFRVGLAGKQKPKPMEYVPLK